MKLGARIILLGHLIIAIGLLGLTTMDILATRPAFDSLETDRVVQLASSVGSIIDSETSRLGAVVSDWATWDPSVTFLQGKNPLFEAENLNIDAFTAIHIERMAFVATDGQVHWSGQLTP
jgi:sensor domain CHASE-containing protein